MLHYFGEQYEEERCNKNCDNCRHPKKKQVVTDEMHQAISIVLDLKENYGVKMIVDYIIGRASKEIKTVNFQNKPDFGVGKEKGELLWHSILRQAILHNLLYKEIEQYGLLKLTDKGREFLKKPFEIEIPMNRDYSLAEGEAIMTGASGGAALDNTLLSMLKDLRKAEGKRLELQPWIIFSEVSLQDMATYYPINKDDILKISGVSQGKASKFGKPFLSMIKDYVEQNEIDRPEDIVVKQVANKSKAKVTVIQGIDRKLSLEDIAQTLDLTLAELLHEMNIIVTSGTKLDISYYLNENLDEGVVEDIFDYFSEADSDSSDDALKELAEDDITMEEILMVRIKFMSEMAN